MGREGHQARAVSSPASTTAGTFRCVSPTSSAGAHQTPGELSGDAGKHLCWAGGGLLGQHCLSLAAHRASRNAHPLASGLADQPLIDLRARKESISCLWRGTDLQWMQNIFHCLNPSVLLMKYPAESLYFPATLKLPEIIFQSLQPHFNAIV